jgi:hypothetical protein
MENQPKSFPVGSAQLCISGLQFKCRLCDKKRTISVTDFPKNWIGSVTHICEHWDDISAMQRGKQPWTQLSQFCSILTEMQARVESHNLEIPLDIRIVG